MPDLVQLFDKYKNNKIALYGLGIETEKVLKEIECDCSIVGLLDGYKEDGMLYGKPIISLREAIESHVKLILVVARPGSCKAIAKRISRICIENQIDLLDIRGQNLCAIKKNTYDFKGVSGISKNYLIQQIKERSVISVDLFDTLIMRQTLFSTDVYEMVDDQLKKRGIFIEDFCGKRLESEKYLAKFMAPTLVEIYSYMKNTYFISEMTADELAGVEWAVDYKLIIPRSEMCELIAQAHGRGRVVYIVSDTYYTKEQLIKLLEKCNITCYTDIFASCDYRTGKTQELFERLKDRICGQTCIHIGDDLVADVESAEKKGICACQIYSGLELLEMVGYLGLWNNIGGLSDRIRVGMFVSRLFNSPFQFETEERKISVRNAFDIGYLFFAPIISDFVLWINERVKDNNIQNIWFCARDGYLIKKLYDELNEDITSTYFLTSRAAAIRAGMENEDDIRYVGEMKFSGGLQEQLQERFGISIEGQKDERIYDGAILEYSREILKKAAVNRKNYQRYIHRLQIKEGNIAFFDFVAKGTSQMYIGRLLKNHLKGFYFLQLEEEHMRNKGLDIVSFYKLEETAHSAVFENYYILETVLTSPKPSIKEFDEQGMPIYAKETRKENDIRCFESIQRGIQDYFHTYLKLCNESIEGVNKKLDELFLALIHAISVSDENFLKLKVEDPFFNRMTDLTDLL